MNPTNPERVNVHKNVLGSQIIVAEHKLVALRRFSWPGSSVKSVDSSRREDGEILIDTLYAFSAEGTELRQDV